METKRPTAKRQVKRGALEVAREEKSLEAQQTQALYCAEIDMFLAMVRVCDRPVVIS